MALFKPLLQLLMYFVMVIQQVLQPYSQPGVLEPTTIPGHRWILPLLLPGYLPERISMM